MKRSVKVFGVMRSRIDASVNYSRRDPRGGMVETRFVQRTPERFIVYLSSMLGCDKACRFCHLTSSGQTNATVLTQDEMVEQAAVVLSGHRPEEAHTVHFNFMARGEPMSNPHVNADLFRKLGALAKEYGLSARIKISTIMPTDMAGRVPGDFFGDGCPPVDLYYSLYSTDPAWRRRWIPKALNPEASALWLKRWQDETGQRVILHWALIDGENDEVAHARAAAALVSAAGVKADFNLVRYNPPNGKSQEATDESIENFMAEISRRIDGRSRRIGRVGPDVKATCGTFLSEA